MVVGEIPELPELPISHNLTALDGSKTSAFGCIFGGFFFGGGGGVVSQGSNRGI